MATLRRVRVAGVRSRGILGSEEGARTRPRDGGSVMGPGALSRGAWGKPNPGRGFTLLKVAWAAELIEGILPVSLGSLRRAMACITWCLP